MKLGHIVPIDAHLLEDDPLKIDESALTAKLLPVTRNPEDEVFSRSIYKPGEIEAIIITT